MENGGCGLLALGVLLAVCFVFPVTAFAIIPFIIISLLIGYCINNIFER